MSSSPRLALSLLAATIGLAVAGPSRAGDPSNVIAVTTTSDAMDAFDQACGLREALANANTNTQFSPVVNECPAGSGSTTDEILLQSGATYLLTLEGDDDASGDLDVHQDPDLDAEVRDLSIGITGGNAKATITQQAAGQRVLHNDGAGLRIVGVSLRGGDTAEVGGGIYNDGGNLVLLAVTLTDNDAVSGGGLYNNGDATLDDVAIVGNGAGLIGGGILHENGSLLVTQSYFGSNEASSGAGLYAGEGETTLQSVNLVSNQASDNGGGILLIGASALTLIDSAVNENVSLASGGGIYSTSSVNMLLQDTDFGHNEAALDGGAIYQTDVTVVAVTGGTFEGNSAGGSGGAIWANHFRTDGASFANNTAAGSGGALLGTTSCVIRDTTVSTNSAHVDGGGARCQNLTLQRSRVDNNLADQRGGGVYVSNKLQIEESTLALNTALVEGGGMWHTPQTDPSTISRTLFQQNVALGNGGGVWLGADENFVSFANSTFSANMSVGGSGSGLYIDEGSNAFAFNTTFAENGPSAGIAKYGELTLQNTIIASAGDDCVVALEDPEIISLGYNISDDDTCIGLDAIGDQMEIDPMLAPLANNGGNTRTHALLDGSPAIDAALNVGCHGTLTQGVDQRGAARPEPAGCDIGAHEQEVVIAEIFSDGFDD